MVPKQKGRKSATMFVEIESGTTVMSSKTSRLHALTIVTALTERSLNQRRRLLDRIAKRAMTNSSNVKRMMDEVRVVGRKLQPSEAVRTHGTVRPDVPLSVTKRLARTLR